MCCNINADWAIESTGLVSAILIGCAARAIPKTYMSSRLQTAWTFSRVFHHNGACPAAVHIIACDYLPLMTHTTWEPRHAGSLKYEIQRDATAAVEALGRLSGHKLNFTSQRCLATFVPWWRCSCVTCNSQTVTPVCWRFLSHHPFLYFIYLYIFRWGGDIGVLPWQQQCSRQTRLNTSSTPHFH